MGCTRPASAPADAGVTKTATISEVELKPLVPPVPQKAVFVDQGDLDAIRARGSLRVLRHARGDTRLPRDATPDLDDLSLVESFAAKHGLTVDLVEVDAFSSLIPWLVEGKGDLIADQLTATKARREKVDFGRSTLAISEVLVGKKGAPNLPRTLEALDSATVFVRPSSAYFETLDALQKSKLPNLKIAPASESEDTEHIVDSVTRGERALTVVDSHLLTAIESYNPDVERLLVLAEHRELAWAVRKQNPKLRATVDRFFVERALTKHKGEIFTGDLDGIKKRKVLRVLTRNNPATYFLHKGRQFGFDFELAKMMATALDVRLEMVVPPKRSDLIPWLREGKGDLIAASMTVTPGRQKEVGFSRPYLFVDEVLVQRRGATKPASLAALADKVIRVRRSSSYFDTLTELKRQGARFQIEEAPEELETEDLIDQVARGDIEYTVADTHLLQVELTYGVEVEAAIPLTQGADGEPGKAIAFALRSNNPQLQAWVDAFVKKTYRGLEYNMAKKRYFEDSRAVRGFKDQRLAKTGRLSPYDELLKKYSERYGLDWRLMAAQAYVESGFDPAAKSWVGAQGLFQVMPRTGESLGFKDLHDPEEGVHAGVLYMSRLIHEFDPEIPFRQRVRLALASYNAGKGHVLDAQRLAREQGWDDQKWFGSVEQAMLMLARPEVAKRARNGFCRGGEPVKYVSSIQSLYDAYIEIAPP